MELRDNRLTLSRKLSELDRDVIGFTSVLDDEGIDYVIVSGYVAILTGRSRSTEDIDTVLEPLSEAELDRLADRLDEEGYWGMAMPLDEMAEMLGGGDRLRVAEDGEMYPNFEVWLASNDLEREALSTAITAEVDGYEVSISSIELQIAYKLRLAEGAGTTNGKDFEDALHLYLTFEDQFKSEQLEAYVEQLGVEDYYAELRGV
jgi:hypothetical protein